MERTQWILEERLPSAREYLFLREAVGWGLMEESLVETGLDKTLYAVCGLAPDGRVAGSARVVGDGALCFYVQDVMVHPDFQRQGLGSLMMERVLEYFRRVAPIDAFMGLMAAKGKEPFYERYGYFVRPNEHFGAGMIQFWGKKRSGLTGHLAGTEALTQNY